jgi:hypothetical protein
MEAMTARLVVRWLSPQQVSFAPNVERREAHGVKEAIACGRLQVYVVRRHDWPDVQIIAGYFPEMHALYLLYGETTEWARDIPSLSLGLAWWVEQPETWRKHLGETREED